MNNFRYKHNTGGFTLMELMIVIAIVGIIVAFAVPSFQDQADKARRSDGKIALEKAAAMQEQQYFANNIYTDSVNELGGSGGVLQSPEQYYRITSSVAASNTGCSTDGVCFILTATAQGAQSNDDTCPTLTLTNTGEKGPSDICWN